MKYSDYPDDTEEGYPQQLRTSLSNFWENKTRKNGKLFKNLKLVIGLVIFGVAMGGVLALLIFALWAVIAISFGVISGISFTSPICWLVGGLSAGVTIYVGLTHKN
jgi:uncharacterized BrkB/YihY/UPF0761 family membrane protein